MSKRLLGLYPQAWRRRYGDEMAALLETSPPGPRTAFDLLRGAMLAHLRSAVRATPLERARVSVSGVLGCFICFCFAGSAFAKTTEARQFTVAGRSHDLLGGAHYAAVVAAVVAAGMLAAAAAPLAVCAIAQARRTHSRELTRLIAVPPLAALAWIASLGGLALWLSAHQHRAGAVAWALLVLSAIVTVGAAASCWFASRAILRRLTLTPRRLALPVVALCGVTACMGAVALATAVYFVAILTDAPALAASADGPGGWSNTTLDIALQLTVMIVLSGAAALSAVRAARGLRAAS